MIKRYVSLLSQDSTDMSSFMDNLVLIFKQCGFTEVDPIGSSADNYRAVQFNNLIIDMWSYSSVIKFHYYMVYDETPTTIGTETSVTVCSRINNTNVRPLSCSLYIFYSDDGNFFALNIAGYTTQIGKGDLVLFGVKTEDNEICYVTGSSSSSGTGYYYSVLQYRVTASLKRAYQKTENVFFKDEGVPVLKSSDNSYVMDLPYLVTLGGAEAQHTYTMTNGDNYYCLIDNIAVKFDTTVFSQTGT